MTLTDLVRRRWLLVGGLLALLYTAVFAFGVWQDRQYASITDHPSKEVVHWLRTGTR